MGDQQDAASAGPEIESGIEEEGMVGKVMSFTESLKVLKSELKEKVSREKAKEKAMDFLENYGNLSKEERKKQFGQILVMGALSYLFDKKNKPEQPLPVPEEAPKKPKTTVSSAIAEIGQEQEPEQEAQEEPEVTVSSDIDIDEAREVVCSDMRLICINTHPAVGKFPDVAVLEKHSSFLNQYGLPKYYVWKREMISMLAPEATSEEEGVNRVTEILQWCPMGKYQCMPIYLFPHVELPFEGEEGLKAMWQFLQTEDLQRQACLGYLMQSSARYGNNPAAVTASYYGGPKAGDALVAVQNGTATEDQKDYVERKQGQYQSIESYAEGTSKGQSGGRLDFGVLLAQVAGTESGALEGKESEERGEEWKNEYYDNYWNPEKTEGDEENNEDEE